MRGTTSGHGSCSWMVEAVGQMRHPRGAVRRGSAGGDDEPCGGGRGPTSGCRSSLRHPRHAARRRLRPGALAARLFDVFISIVSIVDENRIWFKSHHGFDVDQIGRDPGLCASAILQDGPPMVTDAAADPVPWPTPSLPSNRAPGGEAGGKDDSLRSSAPTLRHSMPSPVHTLVPRRHMRHGPVAFLARRAVPSVAHGTASRSGSPAHGISISTQPEVGEERDGGIVL
jgi:hypothetical protein